MSYPTFTGLCLAEHGVHEDFDVICSGACPHGMRPVVQHPQTGRWYICAGHAGFNLPANNGRGYASEKAARRATARLSSKGGVR